MKHTFNSASNSFRNYETLYGTAANNKNGSDVQDDIYKFKFQARS